MPPILHPLPAGRAVAREQFRTVGLSLRREALLAGGALAAFTAWVGLLHAERGHGPELDLVPTTMMPFVVVAFFLALMVWKTEDPARRGYHWSMPVAHAPHALTKALSGLGWLMAGGVAYAAWLVVMAAATGGTLGVEARWGPSGRLFVEVAPWRWLVPFVAASALYGFGTALALASRFPWRWVAGGVVGFVFLSAWDSAVSGPASAHLLDWMWDGRYGMWTLLSGTTSGTGYTWAMLPDFGAWITASALWGGAAAVAVAVAAKRQPRG